MTKTDVDILSVVKAQYTKMRKKNPRKDMPHQLVIGGKVWANKHLFLKMVDEGFDTVALDARARAKRKYLEICESLQRASDANGGDNKKYSKGIADMEYLIGDRPLVFLDRKDLQIYTVIS